MTADAMPAIRDILGMDGYPKPDFTAEALQLIGQCAQNPTSTGDGQATSALVYATLALEERLAQIVDILHGDAL